MDRVRFHPMNSTPFGSRLCYFFHSGALNRPGLRFPENAFPIWVVRNTTNYREISQVTEQGQEGFLSGRWKPRRPQRIDT